jgi:hypothetical protein
MSCPSTSWLAVGGLVLADDVSARIDVDDGVGSCSLSV